MPLSLNRTDLLLLTLLAEEPQHGYSLVQRLERYRHVQETPSASTVYGRLRHLCRIGLLTARAEQMPKVPLRTVYHLSPKGRDALHSTISNELQIGQTTSQELRFEYYLCQQWLAILAYLNLKLARSSGSQ